MLTELYSVVFGVDRFTLELQLLNIEKLVPLDSKNYELIMLIFKQLIYVIIFQIYNE